MKKLIITFIGMILLSGMVFAYTAPTYSSIDLVLESDYTAPTYSSIDLVLGDANSCTCPGDGNNWEIDLEDYCIISDACDLGHGNITFINTGNITFNNELTACGIGVLPANQKGYLGSSSKVNLGGSC